MGAITVGSIHGRGVVMFDMLACGAVFVLCLFGWGLLSYLRENLEERRRESE